MKKSVLILTLLLGLLSACSKFDDLSTALDQQIGIASVAVFNGLPVSTSMELYVDGSRWNANKITQFHNWPSGHRDLKIISRTEDHQEVFQKTVDLDEGKFYSLFVHRDTEMHVIKQEDNPVRPNTGFAKIRIAHLSSRVPSFKLQSGNPSMPDHVIKYKQISEFTTIVLEPFRISGWINGSVADRDQDFECEFTPENQRFYTLIIRDNINPSDSSDIYKIDLIKQ